MGKTYIRVDDRLIHGQIVTAWTKSLDIKRIIAIDDKIAGNAVMKSIVSMGVPKHINSDILSINDTKIILSEPYLDNTLLIVRFARDLEQLIDQLKHAEHLNLGNSSKQNNAALTLSGLGVGQMISLVQEDVDVLNQYQENGIEVIIQQLPTDKIMFWKNIKK